MQIFEYPYIIITILVFCFLIMGMVGLYFTMKSVKTVNGTEEKTFCGISRLENDFEKAVNGRKNRCLVYISVYLESMSRLYPKSKSTRILSQIRSVLLKHFCLNTNGNISLCGADNFLAINDYGDESIKLCIENCFSEINKILIEYEAVNIAHIKFGYYCTNSTEVSFKMALGRAKQACTMAEDKNILYCQWDSSKGKEFERKIKIENNIQNEIENNRFFLEYQPIIDAKTEKLVGAEVLSRLNSQTDGILTPHAFLSAVNNVGVNQKFDYYIFEKNCKWISNNKNHRENYVYTINFSRCTLCDEEFAENLISILEKYNLNYSCIAVEILEDKDLTEEEKKVLTKNLAYLKEKGILFLLDDFGKGYTSFGDLAAFDVSIVKIDKSITQNATSNSGFLILKNIIRTAKDLGFKTLCEGIETEEHKKLATDAGCDMLQGFYFYRPMPVTQFESLFENN